MTNGTGPSPIANDLYTYEKGYPKGTRRSIHHKGDNSNAGDPDHIPVECISNDADR